MKTQNIPTPMPELTIDWNEVTRRRNKFSDDHRSPSGLGVMYSARDLIDFDDGSDQFFAERIVYDPAVKTICLRFRYDYEIRLSRIKSPRSLLGWVDHLLGKNWMNGEFIRQFVRRVCEIKGWNLHPMD